MLVKVDKKIFQIENFTLYFDHVARWDYYTRHNFDFFTILIQFTVIYCYEETIVLKDKKI